MKGSQAARCFFGQSPSMQTHIVKDKGPCDAHRTLPLEARAGLMVPAAPGTAAPARNAKDLELATETAWISQPSPVAPRGTAR